MNAILRVLNGEIAYIGTHSECNLRKCLLEKWGRCWNVDSMVLFDEDGLTYYSHSISLYIQNDQRAWQDMLELFEKTKQQGKTNKTIEKKVKYLQHGIGKLLYNHRTRLILQEEDRHEWHADEGFYRYWINYYFATYDGEMNFTPILLYQVGEQSKAILENVETLESNNHGIVTPPKFTVPASEIEVKIVDHAFDGADCYVKFEWDETDDASHLMGLFKKDGWKSNNGEWCDMSGEQRLKLEKLIKGLKCKVETMNTPTNLYQQSNKWFYIYFHWQPKDFTWKRVKKVEKIIKELVVPYLKNKFRPANEPKKYSTMTIC